ncbi:MAG: O-antigen ligase family protein [Deltaproteobacteria bacterium]|nr:O-antigen ligase family protein [Deltaproteobacteria bacterium]
MNTVNSLDISKFLRFFLYILILFQPFTRFNSFREIGFYGLLLFFAVKLFKNKPAHLQLNDKTIITIFFLVTWSLLVSIFGPYPLDSLNAIRKNLLVEVLIFLVIITEFKTIQELKTLFLVVVASFSVITLAAISENALSDWTNFHQLTKTHQMFIGGYANNATFYLPFIAVWLTAVNETAWKKWLGSITLLSGLIIVFIYNSRTAMIAIPMAIFITFLLSKRYKLLIVSLAIFILCMHVIFSSKSDVFSKYRSLSNPETYITKEGTSKRFSIWQGASHIIKERPFVGYGYGWKKMAWVVKDSGHQKYWKEKHPDIYDYYIEEAHSSYGKVNPHNLILQIIFEIGLIGLALFIGFWATVISKIFKVASSEKSSEMRNFMLYSFGIPVSYIMINITNGFWQEAYGNIIFMFIASIFVIHRQYINQLELNGR